MLIEIKAKIKLPIIGRFLPIFDSGEEFPDVIFSEQGATQYSHDLHNGTFKFEVVLDDTHEAIGDDCDMNLYFLANDKESTGHRDLKQAGKVKVSSIKDIAGQCFVCEPIHSVDIVNIGIGDSIEYGNLSNDVHLRVYLNTRLRASKLCPAKERHTEVDGSGINSIKSAMKFKLSRNPSLLCEGHHVEGKLLKDAIVSEIVSLGKRTSVDGCLPKSEMKRLLRMSGCYIREFPESAAAHKLSKHESEQMAPVGRYPFFSSIVGIGHKPFEKPFGQKADYLREYILSYMHTCSSFGLEAKVYISKVRQGFQYLHCCA